MKRQLILVQRRSEHSERKRSERSKFRPARLLVARRKLPRDFTKSRTIPHEIFLRPRTGSSRALPRGQIPSLSRGKSSPARRRKKSHALAGGFNELPGSACSGGQHTVVLISTVSDHGGGEAYIPLPPPPPQFSPHATVCSHVAREFRQFLRKFAPHPDSHMDDVLESWEQIEESGALDKRLEALRLHTVEDELESSRTSHDAGTRMIILGEDGIRSQYVPPKPMVKILKRPTANSRGSGDGPDDKPKQPIKSLKQREQEYAEARRRILGEEKSPEEKTVQEINKIQAKSSTPNGNNFPSNVIRMPTGPDGTRGFNVRR
ncbi:uncharacterized protein LOC105837956 [Monomorium pharaonis]|uniref:uncharacterized protein LOC105837956 n=1 Tax=Monomorium pharaonis TaxID=307658 RepID=UPI00063F5DAA|nr:uncharacterized protein LOC105837956 [Monomorium pharaonis]